MNAIIEAALRYNRTVLSILVLIAVAGIYSFISIPKEAEPDINVPIIYVSLSHQGISPEDAERLLLRPMEQELESISGVKELRSTGFLGGGNVTLEFDAGFDVDLAMQDVREAVDLAKTNLPPETDEPSIHEINLSEFPIFVVTLSGDVPERTLLKLSQRLSDEIESIPTVLSTNIGGDREELVEILVDPVTLESYGLDMLDVARIVGNANQLVAAGSLDTGTGRFAIKVPGLFETVEDVLNMPIKVLGDVSVRFRDVAVITRSFKDPHGFARMNGRSALTIEVSKRSGANIIATIDKVRAVVQKERRFWPDGVTVSFSQDKSQQVRSMLSDLTNNVLAAVILVLIVVVGVLGVRSGSLVGLAIPGSFMMGFLFLFSAGFTVNIVVLFSLILASGMLVDGAIVVVEYADRRLSEGVPARQAYGEAAKRMAWPIIASTATTLAAFAPLAFWPGVVGEFMKYLPITLLVTLSASLLMALVFIPVLGTLINVVVKVLLVIGGAVLGMVIAPGFALESYYGALAGALVGYLLAVVFLWFSPAPGKGEVRQEITEVSQVRGFAKIYAYVLGGILRVPYLVVIAAVAALIGSWVAYGKYGNGVEFFPSVEPEQAKILIHARGNLSIYEMDALIKEAEDLILELHEEKQEFHAVYALSQASSNRQNNEAEDVIGSIQLELTDWFSRRPAGEILDEVRERTSVLAGIQIEIAKEESGPPTGKDVQVQIGSKFPELVESTALQIASGVRQIADLVDVEEGRPIPGIEWQLAVDRSQAAKFGVDVALVGAYVRMITNGMKVTTYRPDDADEEIDIVVRLPKSYRNIAQLDKIRVQSQFGTVPISSFVTRTAKPTVGIINRIDGTRVMTVKANVAEGVNVAEKVEELQEWLKTQTFDPRVDLTFRGEDEEQQKAQAFLMKAFIVALFIMAVILITQFNSFYSAFLILSAVIMSTVGVMLGLLVTGQPFGIVMTGVGVVALAGIVVNNNIVLIDTYNDLLKRTATARDAIILTGAQRLRPVLLTTVTTILGLMPMVLSYNIDFVNRVVQQGAPSSQWWVQLAAAIAWGLSFATILTLFVTPSALMLQANVIARSKRRKAKKSKQVNDYLVVTEQEVAKAQEEAKALEEIKTELDKVEVEAKSDESPKQGE